MKQNKICREAATAAQDSAAQQSVQAEDGAGLRGGKPRKVKNASIFNGKAQIFVICMLAYAVINFAIFYVWMNIDSILLAFKTYNGMSGEQEFLDFAHLFDNFKEFFVNLFTSSGTLPYFLRGALYHLTGFLIAYPVSLIFSYLIYKKLFLHNFFKVMLYVPSIVSAMVISIMFKTLAENFLPAIFPQLGNAPLSDEAYATPLLVIYSIFFAMPGQLIINTSTMSTVPQELIEYGKLEGITMRKEFLHVVLPLVYPLITVQCLGLFVGLFTAAGPLYAIYAELAPDYTVTYGYYIFTRVIGRNASEAYYGFTAASNLAIGLISVPIVYFTKWLLERFDPEAEY